MRNNRTALEAYMLRMGAGNRSVFMPYVTAGYPSPKAMPQVFRMLADAGAHCVEIGVPFSDPVADGPTIQESTTAALRAGVTPADCLRMAETASRSGLRVIMMGYANPWMSMGLRTACRRMADAGVQGLIVPDLPVEESDEWRAAASAYGISFPLFAAPNTPTERLKAIDRKATGFIYYVSVSGVTGERNRFPAGLLARLRWMRANLDTPVAIGFGVSTPAQVAQLAPVTSGIIVGSALVRRLSGWLKSPKNRANIMRWTASMARSANRAIE
jgi:tryptophan synthase alpha chain